VAAVSAVDVEQALAAELDARAAAAVLSPVQRVELGATWLGGDDPGWWAMGRLRLDLLDLTNCLDCVLGQLYGGYERVVRCGSPPCESAVLSPDQAVLLGFAASHRSGRAALWVAESDALTAAWVALVGRRRGGS
jgi:hypothetical protein